MTERTGRNKQHNEMRSAAIIALISFIGVCVLCLLVALPLRAMRARNEGTIAETTPIPTPTIARLRLQALPTVPSVRR
jgi:hypothetical protein